MKKFNSQIPFLVASWKLNPSDLLSRFNQENNTNYSDAKQILPHFKWLVRQVLDQHLS